MNKQALTERMIQGLQYYLHRDEFRVHFKNEIQPRFPHHKTTKALQDRDLIELRHCSSYLKDEGKTHRLTDAGRAVLGLPPVSHDSAVPEAKQSTDSNVTPHDQATAMAARSLPAEIKFSYRLAVIAAYQPASLRRINIRTGNDDFYAGADAVADQSNDGMGDFLRRLGDKKMSEADAANTDYRTRCRTALQRISLDSDTNDFAVMSERLGVTRSEQAPSTPLLTPVIREILYGSQRQKKPACCHTPTVNTGGQPPAAGTGMDAKRSRPVYPPTTGVRTRYPTKRQQRYSPLRRGRRHAYGYTDPIHSKNREPDYPASGVACDSIRVGASLAPPTDPALAATQRSLTALFATRSGSRVALMGEAA